jgi:uncharacterized protein YukE
MDFISDIGSAVGGIAGGVASVASGVLRLVTPQMDEVLGQLGNAQKLIEEQVQNPIKEMLKAVDDSTWTGPGAEAFKQELNQTFLPQMGTVLGGIGGLIGSLTQAKEAVQGADKEAAARIDALQDQFKNIFKE